MMSETNSNGEHNDNDSQPFFETPKEKKERKRKPKIPKGRLHIYLTQDLIEKIEAKSAETGLNQSSCCQMLIAYALVKLKNTTPDIL